jgi:hypothetical protein
MVLDLYHSFGIFGGNEEVVKEKVGPNIWEPPVLSELVSWSTGSRESGAEGGAGARALALTHRPPAEQYKSSALPRSLKHKPFAPTPPPQPLRPLFAAHE